MNPLRSDAGVVLPDSALRESHRRLARVSVLDDLFNPLPGLVLTGDEGHALDGSVSQDASRAVRRTLDLSIANPGGVWTPTGPGSAFYWNRLLRVERGVLSGSTAFWAPLGVFLIDTPSYERSVLHVSGADRVDRALRSKFTSPASYASGSPVGSTIQDILVDAGIGSERWSVDDGGAVLGATRSYEADDERLSAAKTLATDFGLEVLADANGYVVVRPKRDPAGLPSAWTFAEGVDSTLLGLSKSWSRERFYNHVVVIGESADLSPIRAEASITDPSSPLRVTGPMGDRLYTYKSAMVTTVPQAQGVAASLLWQHALIEEELTVDHVPHPGLEAGDAVTITHPESATSGLWAVDSITVPLAGGSARLGVHRTRSA